jgi:CBS domain-containing protein
MTCPACYHNNLPGDEQCRVCGQSLIFLDEFTGCNRVERSLLHDTVGELRPHLPVTIRPDALIGEAVNALLANDIGALLVVDDIGKLVGIFSERDLLTKVACEPTCRRAGSPPGADKTNAHLRVRDLMTARPETVVGEDKLAFVLHKMDVGGYRHLPVVRDGKPVGVISVRDMLRHITRLCGER